MFDIFCLFFNSNFTKILAVYTCDTYFITPKKNFYQMFGSVVLDLGENTLICGIAENTKSLSLNISLKAVLYFYIFLAKKSYCNYKATKTSAHHSFKIKMNNFNSLFGFHAKLFTDHKNTFILTKTSIYKTVRGKLFFRSSTLLDGVALNASNDLFQNLYKDIRQKTFCISAKFAKALILF